LTCSSSIKAIIFIFWGVDENRYVAGRYCPLYAENKTMDIANYTEYVWNNNLDEDPFFQFLNKLVSEW